MPRKDITLAPALRVPHHGSTTAYNYPKRVQSIRLELVSFEPTFRLPTDEFRVERPTPNPDLENSMSNDRTYSGHVLAGAAAGLDIDSYTIVVFAGPCPEPGAQHHEAKPLWWFGDEHEYRSATSGTIEARDRFVDLDCPDYTSESAWVLLRPRRPADAYRVLVVEDSLVNLDFYLEVLTGSGLQTSGATTGTEALALAEEHRFGLVISDIRLPDTNGFELCRSLSAMPDFDSPVLLMSADPALADNDRVVEAGALGFIANPIAPAALVDKVSWALEQSHPDLLYPKGEPTATQPVERPELQFFGEAKLVVGDRSIKLPRGRSTELMATLAAGCPVSVSPERLARFVWLADTPVSSNAIYTAISRLRSFLADAGLAELVSTEGTGYALNLTSDQVDLSVFETEARKFLQDPEAAEVGAVRALLDTWTERPFASTRNALLTRWSVRLSETRAQLLELLAQHHLRRNEYLECEHTCQELLAAEPWRELIWGLRIVSLYLQGRSNDALNVFATARERLRDELGLDPGPMLSNIELMVLSHDPRLGEQAWLDEMMGHRLN